ncbi:MAG: tetratricopeptide repeat protein [Gemmatimonadota bacterium]|nr:MAG: tetratricopeptide repeat protein [Gemmatimonadota bacterium]
MSSLLQRLKERKLFQWSLAYLAGAWLIFQGIEVLAEPWNLSVGFQRVLHVLLGVGFLVTLVLAWYHGEKGRQRATGIELMILAGILVVAGAAVAVLGRGEDAGREPIAERAEAASSVIDPKSVAVLPFVNLSADPENEYFSDGITGDIINRLAKVTDLQVIARTSVMQYKNTEKPIRLVGRELRVATVVEGEVQRMSGRVRINAQLIDADTDLHLWADAYDRELTAENYFEIQSEIAQQIAVALQAELAPAEERGKSERRPTDNLEAYDLYLLARQYWDSEQWQAAIDLFEDAIELDPDFALAYAWLAMAEADFYWLVTEARTDERLARVRRAAERAVQIDPDLPDAHLAIGWYYYKAYDYERALQHFAIARDALPGDSYVSTQIAPVLRALGNWEEAADNFRKSFESNPRSDWAARELGFTYHVMHRFAEAEEYYDRAIQLGPDDYTNYLSKAALYVSWEGDRERARTAIREAWARIQPAPLFAENYYLHWWVYRIIDEDYERTLRRLAAGLVETDTTGYYLTKAELHRLSGDAALARASYDSARVLLESRLISASSDIAAQAHIYSQLGLAYAGLGRKAEAVRAAERAVTLFPVSKRVDNGLMWAAFLAETYVMVSEYDAAVAQLEYVLSIPGSYITAAWLRVDPMWDPLRDHPRFQALLERHE